MTDSRYNNNAITNQKKIKPIANGNAADSSMIPLLLTSHFHVENLKQNERLNVNLE